MSTWTHHPLEIFEICSAEEKIRSDSVSLLDLKYQIWGPVKFEIVLYVAEMKNQSSFLLVVC